MLRRFNRFVLTWLLRKGPKQSLCPNCNNTYPSPRTLPPYDLDGTVTCPHCQYRSSLLAWGKNNFRPKNRLGDPSTNLDDTSPSIEKPADSRITRIEAPDGSIAWNIPQTGRSGGLLFFAILWNLFSGGIFIFLLYGAISEGSQVLLPLLFMLLFVAVGVVMLYFGLRHKYATHLLGVSPSKVMLDRTFFGRKKRFTLPADAIDSVQMKEFYQQNYEPVYGIEIRGPKGKIRFGSALNDNEKQWLVQEIRNALHLTPTEQIVASSAHEEKARKAEQSRKTHRRLKVEQVGKVLTITTPPQGFQWAALIVGFAFIAFAAFVALGSSRSFDGFSTDDPISFVFELIFIFVPLLFCFVFITAGFSLVLLGINRSASFSTLVVTPGGAEWKKETRNKTREQRRLDRSKILDVRIERCPYEVNNVPSYRGEIVGPDFVLPFGFYCNPEKIREGAKAARSLLKLPDKQNPVNPVNPV